MEKREYVELQLELASVLVTVVDRAHDDASKPLTHDQEIYFFLESRKVLAAKSFWQKKLAEIVKWESNPCKGDL